METREAELALKEATALAVSLFNQHYRSDGSYASGEVVWKPFDDIRGVISQIDNMTVGLVRPAAATLNMTAEAVPVAADPSVWGVYVSSDGRYTNLSSDDKEEARQIGEDHFSFGVEMRPLYTHPDPEAARLREDLERVKRERDTFSDICLVVSGHLELPHSESGPCDDLRRYDRALEASDVYYRQTEAARVEHMEKRFKAEAEAEKLKRERDDAVKALETAREDERDRLLADAEADKFEFFRLPSDWLRSCGAMLPTERAVARSASSQGSE